MPLALPGRIVIRLAVVLAKAEQHPLVAPD
jgi:hypothetical protein